MECGSLFQGKILELDVLAQRVPICPLCPPPAPKPPKKGKKLATPWDGGDESESDTEDSPRAILKVFIRVICIDDDDKVHYSQPNITFFGEKLTDRFDKLLRLDRETVDLLIVMGTSLKVHCTCVLSYSD